MYHINVLCVHVGVCVYMCAGVYTCVCICVRAYIHALFVYLYWVFQNDYNNYDWLVDYFITDYQILVMPTKLKYIKWLINYIKIP